MALRAQPWSWGDRFALYLRRLKELDAEPAVTEHRLNVGFTLNVGEGGGSFAIRQPPEPMLRSFLLTFRQFISKSDPAFVNAIANELLRQLDEPDLRTALIAARTSLRQAEKAAGISFAVDGSTLDAARALDLWINGHYFHNDSQKFQALGRLNEGLGGPIARYVALDLIVETTKVIYRVGWVIRQAQQRGLLIA